MHTTAESEFHNLWDGPRDCIGTLNEGLSCYNSW